MFMVWIDTVINHIAYNYEYCHGSMLSHIYCHGDIFLILAYKYLDSWWFDQVMNSNNYHWLYVTENSISFFLKAAGSNLYACKLKGWIISYLIVLDKHFLINSLISTLLVLIYLFFLIRITSGTVIVDNQEYKESTMASTKFELDKLNVKNEFNVWRIKINVLMVY